MFAKRIYLSFSTYFVFIPRPLRRDRKIIVFFTTARLTQFAAAVFNQPSVQAQLGSSVLEIHSRKAQNARTKASNLFRESAQVRVKSRLKIYNYALDYYFW